jgi:hypothetical protein
MTHKHSLSFVLILLCLPSYGHAQLWSGILASSRATDWTTAGVKNGIPSANWMQCGSTIAAYTGDASLINNAIANCGTNQYVQLGAGTFVLSSAIVISRSNVAIRGMGASQTDLQINALSSSSYCAGEGQAVIYACGMPGSPSYGLLANWTGGYAQGSTQITLNNLTTTAPSAGQFIELNQLDNTSDSGDIYVCQFAGANCSNGGYGAWTSPANRAENEAHEIQSISGSGTGPYTVNLVTPIKAPNWNSGQSPGALWYPTAINNVGLENLTVDWSAVTNLGAGGGVEFTWVQDSWIKGVAIITTATRSACSTIAALTLEWTFRVTIQDSYFYGLYQPVACGTMIWLINACDSLVQNNIIHNTNQGFISNSPTSGSVIAYNFAIGTSTYINEDVFDVHGAGEFMNLFEGNENPTSAYAADDFHGSHFMQTWFRNSGAGYEPFYSGNPYRDEAFSRFSNLIGNVLGTTVGGFTDYQTNQAYDRNAIYVFGWDETTTCGSGCTMNTDPNVLRTDMRWGNWDEVSYANSTPSGGVHWCGSATAGAGGTPDTGWSSCVSGGWGYQGASSEIPSTITNYPNSVPTLGDTGAGQGALPASFYLSSKPSWWQFPSAGAISPWPGIGPDITGGNVPNTAGHVYLNPAASCYYNIMGGPVDGSGGPLSFNAGTCYPPAPPTDLVAAAD